MLALIANLTEVMLDALENKEVGNWNNAVFAAAVAANAIKSIACTRAKGDQAQYMAQALQVVDMGMKMTIIPTPATGEGPTFTFHKHN